jgi:acyl-CoA synthetase (NDP forming)
VDLTRLLHPRSVAVVGATERHDSYAAQTLINLDVAGFPGAVWGVNPGREQVFGRPCFPSLSACPEPPDAVVVAIPAAGVAEVIDEAGALGCGGAVVYGAGFGEMQAGARAQGARAGAGAGSGDAETGAAHERDLREAALRHGLPVCGPNANGIVALHERAALWGDALRPFEPGRVALVSQSGNVSVNALNANRGLRLHTVVSCGNAVGLDPAVWVAQLAAEPGVGAVALYLEADGDGALLAEALGSCAEHGVGVAVLKVGVSAAGSAAAAAHTGAVAGDQRVFRALVEEAGGAWASDVHELLELAKALSVPGQRRRSAGLAVLTCSGGDSALAADECERLGLALPPLAPDTVTRLRDLLPGAATVGNPLDYTALIWGEVETLRDIVAVTGEDPAIGRELVLYDQPVGIDGASEESWSDVREGIHRGAAESPVPVMVASTLPDLLDDAAAARFAEDGIPAISGLRTGLACAAALDRAPADPGRLRAIAEAARRATRAGGNGRPEWLSEHEAKELLRTADVAVPRGRLVRDEHDAVAALDELGGPVAIKLISSALRHKSDAGAVALGLHEEGELREAHRRLSGLELDLERPAVLVERMAEPGAELLVAARADAVVPSLVLGAGGLWTELLADAAVVPLPASPERVEQAIRGLRAAPLFSGGRGGVALDVAAAAALAAAAGELLLDAGLELIELNPVLVHEHGATVVDALAVRA